MKTINIIMVVSMVLLVIGCTNTQKTNQPLSNLPSGVDQKTEVQKNMARELVPAEFDMKMISEDEYKFANTPDGVNRYILTTTWNNGASIILLEGKEDAKKPDCHRGTLFEPEIRNNYGITDETAVLFYCNDGISYEGKDTGDRFAIWKIVLEESDNPNILRVVDYQIESESS